MRLVYGRGGMIRTRTDGFSLIELMIVVGLIAVLAGVAAPAVAAGMRRYSLITASQQIASTIRAARYQAVGRNVRLRVRFNHPQNGTVPGSGRGRRGGWWTFSSCRAARTLAR